MTHEAVADEKVFDVVFECKGVNSAKMRTDMVVNMVKPDHHCFEMATDEGKFHGGDGTAPPPLALFAAGLTSCLITQLRAFSKRMRIPVDGIEVMTKLRWRAVQKGSDPYVSQPVGFDLDVELLTDAPLEDQLRLLQAAKRGCFIEQTLIQANTLAHRLRDGDVWINA